VVTWFSESQDGENGSIFARRFDRSGQPLGSEFQVNSYTIGEQTQPHLCCDSAGNFVVTWASDGQDGMFGYGVFAQRFASSGAPDGTEFQVNTYTIDEQAYPRACCGDVGSFVISWASDGQDGDDDGIFAQRYDSSGGPSGQEFQVNSYTVGAQEGYLDVCCDASGNFVVAWEDNRDGDGMGIAARSFDDTGAPRGDDFIVNGYTLGQQGSPALNCGAGGNFNVAWQSINQDGDSNGVFARSFDSAGQPLHGEIQVNSYTLDSQFGPDVCCDGAGNFTVAWSSQGQDGDAPGIFAHSFGVSGVALGPEFQVNTHTIDSQTPPGVSCDSAGNLAVVWTDLGGRDGHEGGVFAQLFQAMGGPPSAVPVTGAAGLALLVGALAGGGVALLSRRRRR
jgi:hypothetical protein